jgi:hypothetical protein
MPATNQFDRKLTAVLKALNKGVNGPSAMEKISKDFLAIRSRIVDPMLGPILDDLFKSLSTSAGQVSKPELAKTVDVVRALCTRQFVSSAAFLFAKWRDLIASQSLDTILPLAPDAASFEVWRKASASPTREIENQLMAVPTVTYATAGADWLLLRVPPEKLLALLELFLTRQPRPKYLPAWSEALTTALQKDNRSALLRIILADPSMTEDRLSALAEVTRGNPVLMKAAIDALPQMLTAADPSLAAVPFVRQLFVNLISTTGTERQFVSASLARLGTGILLHHAIGSSGTEALDFIQQATSQLRGATRDAEIQSRTWVLENLDEEKTPTDGRLHITLDGARRFAVAFEKAAQDFPAIDILAMTARNLGLSPIGGVGNTVPYDPLQHEDTEGGMLPGDPALIESQGWAHSENVILRARVRKTTG